MTNYCPYCRLPATKDQALKPVIYRYGYARAHIECHDSHVRDELKKKSSTSK